MFVKPWQILQWEAVPQWEVIIIFILFHKAVSHPLYVSTEILSKTLQMLWEVDMVSTDMNYVRFKGICFVNGIGSLKGFTTINYSPVKYFLSYLVYCLQPF